MLLQNYKYAKFSGYFETRKQSFLSAFSICMAVPYSVPKVDLRLLQRPRWNAL